MRTMNNQKWYTPREIARLGLIQNSRGDLGTENSTYKFVITLIKSGKLRAKNYSIGKQRQNWLVPQSEIDRYHDTVTKIDNKGEVR